MSRKLRRSTSLPHKKSASNADPKTLQEAITAHREGDFIQAEASYRKILATQPRHADVLNLLATLYQQQGKFREAPPLLDRAITLQPYRPDFYSNLGSALRSMGELKKAVTAFNKALSLQPGHFESQFNLAMTYKDLGDLPGAAQGFRTILATRPSFIPAHEMLAQIMLSLGQWEEALGCFREIMHFAPRHSSAFFEAGNILQMQNKLGDAVTCYKRALEIDPTYAVAHNNLGNTLVKLGNLHDALQHYQEAIHCNHTLSEAYINLSWTYKEHGMLDEDISCLRQYLRQRPDDHRAHSDMLFSMNYDPTYSPKQLYEEAQGWWQQHAPRKLLFDHRNRVANPKLRIGFLSPDFRQHPVGTFLAPLFSMIDRKSVSLYCYAEMHDHQQDGISNRIRTYADAWTTTTGLTAEKAADLIHHDHIDILIDLAGHSANNRLDVMALKPAPVQASWLGYVNTTGLPVIDYRITDAIADPPGVENRYSERLFRMPDAFFCFEPSSEAQEIGPLPALVQGGKITFGSFNNLAKITPQVIETWASILQRTPKSKLLIVGAPLSDEFIANRYISLFAAQGVSQERLILRNSMPLKEYLALYNSIDLALDPFPHNGHTITCHTLWMGVPVITLLGDRYAARMGASVLHGVGLPELVAPSIPDYITLATTLAQDIDRLAALRRTMRDRLMSSPICDTSRFAKNFHKAVLSMVEPLHFHG